MLEFLVESNNNKKINNSTLPFCKFILKIRGNGRYKLQANAVCVCFRNGGTKVLHRQSYLLKA